MELIERYLQAIGRYLPTESRADILAELRSELLEQMDARSEEWGRPLDEADIAALLKAHGRPEAIALRYLPQRSLIGPSVFPFYILTLKKVLPLVLIVYLVANTATLFFSATGGELLGHFVHALAGLVPALFIGWGAFTVVFAVIDYARSKPSVSEKLNQWDPMKLPALEPEQAVKQKSFNMRLLELAVHCLWILYVIMIPVHPFLIFGPGARAMSAAGVGLAPVFHPFYVLILVMLGVQLVMKIVGLRSGEQRLVKPLDFVANLLGIWALSMLAFAKQIIVPLSGGMDASKLASTNHALSLAFRLALLFAVYGLIKELWKYFRSRIRVRRALAV